MKHKLLTTLTAALLALSAWANGTKINGIYYNLYSNTKTADVTFTGNVFNYNPSSTAYTGSITIPSSVTYDGTTYSVTDIGIYAFRGCTGLTSITIPNSVTSIGEDAFYYCSGLTSINIPSSVTSIEHGAFYRCTSLTSIKVAAGNTKYDSRDNCNAIIVTASNTLVVGCKATTIPNSVTRIGIWAFNGCTGLTSIDIPNSVTSIGSKAFRDCTSLTSITIPNSVTDIGDYAFADCTGLTSIDIPNSVTRIEQNAFNGCTGLTSITIPNSVTSILFNAFAYCSGLTSITIPSSVTSIDSDAFSGCTGLTDIYALRTNPEAYNCDTSAFDDVTTSTCTLHVPKGSKEAYEALWPWSNFDNIVEDAKPSTEPADLNGDGSVNVGDVTTLVNMILGKTPMSDDADLNGDGSVNVGDVTTLVNRILGKE